MAGLITFVVALAVLSLAVTSINLLLGVAIAVGSVLIAAALIVNVARAIGALWPASAVALAIIVALTVGGIAAVDAATPGFSTTRATGSVSESIGVRVNNWRERVNADLRHDDYSSGSPSGRLDWSQWQPTTKWRSLETWRSKPLPSSNWRSQSWRNNLPSYNPPPVRYNPPVYNPPPRIPSYNPPVFNVPSVPSYNPPVFNPPMPRVPPMPVFPRY